MTTGAVGKQEIGLCSGFGQWHSPNNKRDPRQYVTVTMPDIIAMMENPPSVEKAKAQWVIFSTLPSRVHAEQREHGQFYALWADIDDTLGMPFAEIVDRANGCLLDFLAYTTRSASEEKQKARVVVPLAEPVSGSQFVIRQKVLNDKLEENGIAPDRATERAGQVCHLPNRGEFYRYHIENSTGPMSLDAWADKIRQEQERIDAAKRAARERRERAREKATRRMQAGCKSPIDAYNAEFNPEMELESHGYVRRGRRYLSPNSESGVPGVKITDDGKKWLSTHGSDSGIGTPTSNGTMGDAFDLFTYYEHGGDRNRAIKAAGEMFGLKREPAPMPDYPPALSGKDSSKNGPKQSKEEKGENPIDGLIALSVGKDYCEMLGDESWFFQNLIIKGQIHVIIAKSGGGKTTIFFDYISPWILKNHDIEILFLDCDSPASDHKSMFKRADKNGHRFHWINPIAHGRGPEDLLKMLNSLVEKKSSLSGKLFILDTLKKFVNLLDKRSVKPFFVLMRQLVSLGATVVLLGHANKYRDAAGLLVFEGVGDVQSDTDALIFFERMSSVGGIDITTVVDPDKGAKVRGLFEPISFHIEQGHPEGYQI